jgi:hypothetical protein
MRAAMANDSAGLPDRAGAAATLAMAQITNSAN